MLEYWHHLLPTWKNISCNWIQIIYSTVPDVKSSASENRSSVATRPVVDKVLTTDIISKCSAIDYRSAIDRYSCTAAISSPTV